MFGCRMIDCAHIRLENLRHLLKPTGSQVQAKESVAKALPVQAHFEDGCAVLPLNASKSRFTVTPVKESVKTSPLSTLSVQCSANSSEKRLLNVSPADSTDSGIPSSPNPDAEDDTLSPLPSSALSKRFDFKANGHALPNLPPKFRNRSASECLDVRPFGRSGLLVSSLSMNSSNESNVSANGTLLRSILKKPKVLPPGMGNTQLLGQVGLKRTQTRYLLARSISECQDESFRINFSLDHLKLDEEVVSIDDLDIPLSVCDESEEFNNSFADDEPEKPSEEHQQKKRVSFNEQVYARVYRSSSSILASRNRQERRHQQQRKKRTESETSEDDSSKVEAKKSPSQEEIVALAGGDTGKVNFSHRRDSGIDDEVDDEEPSDLQKRQFKRHSSRDSALGEDIEL